MRAERSETPSVLGKRPPLAQRSLESCEDTLVVSKRARSINMKRVQWASPIAVDESGEPCQVRMVPEWIREAQALLDATGWAPGFIPPPTPAQPPPAFGAAAPALPDVG